MYIMYMKLNKQIPYFTMFLNLKKRTNGCSFLLYQKKKEIHSNLIKICN